MSQLRVDEITDELGTGLPSFLNGVNVSATAPSSPSAGDLYFDSGDNKLKCYDGTSWQNCF